MNQRVNEPNRLLSVSQIERDRRRDHRRPQQVKVVVTVLDGQGEGSSHEILSRDLSPSGMSFLLKDELKTGQTCRVVGADHGQAFSYFAEVVRSRPLSSGKYEMAVVFRKSV